MADTSTSDGRPQGVLRRPVAEEVEHPADRRADDGIGAVLQLPAHPDLLLDGRGPGDPAHGEPDPDVEPVLDAGEHGQRDPRRAVGRGRGPGEQGDGGPGRVGNALGRRCRPTPRSCRSAYSHPDPRDGARRREGVRERVPHLPDPRRGRTRMHQARQAIQTQIDQLRSDLEDAQTALEVAPAGSSDETVAANEVNQLSSQIAGLNTQIASLVAPDITPGTLIQPAEVPTSPSSPNHRQDVALGFVAGLVLGVGFAFLRERMDDRIHGRAQLEAAVGAPVLAVVPKVPGWRKRSADEARHDVGVREPGRRGLPLAAHEPAVHLARRERAGHLGDQPARGRGQDHDGRQPRHHARAHRQAGHGALGRSAQASAAPVLRPGQREGTLLGPRRSGGARRGRPASGGSRLAAHRDQRAGAPEPGRAPQLGRDGVPPQPASVRRPTTSSSTPRRCWSSATR